MDKKNPHDKLFKATFSIRREAIALAKNFLPNWISENLDYEDFELNHDSFISEEMEEYFMDIVYQTKWRDETKAIKISLIFEHKSYPDDHIRTQMSLYLSNAYARQRLNKESYHLVLPILLYHGKSSMKIKQISELFKLPNPDLAKYVPSFDMIMIDITQVADEQIIKVQEAVFLKSTLLLFKHRDDTKGFLQIAEEVFIFVERDLNETERRKFVKLYLNYIFTTHKIKRAEAQIIKQKIPKMIVQEFTSYADELRFEGKIEGKIEEKAIERFNALLLFLKDFPDWSNAQIGKYARLKMEKVVAFKKLIRKEKEHKKIFEEVKKIFLKDIEISLEGEKQIKKSLKNFLKK